MCIRDSPATVNDQSVSIVLCHIRAYTQADGAILSVQVFHFQGCRYELPCAGEMCIRDRFNDDGSAGAQTGFGKGVFVDEQDLIHSGV